ncbi:MAG: ArnT family glycosyltransferase [Candidatus Promineifilaceae bacterium]
MRNTLLALIVILLLALGLRLFRLNGIPPGLTHDEANHGREALEIRDGVLRYYFPLNYGSEPLYSYMVAGSMSVLGENVFALRFVNVVFGVAAIAMTAVWANRAFDKATALIAAGLMAVSFWPLASSREALRAGMLPFFMVLAVWFFWQITCNPCGEERPPFSKKAPGDSAIDWRLLGLVLGFALSIVATFHIYLAARVAWLLFPFFLLYLALFHRSDFRRSWQPALAGLLLAGLLVLPMFVYLAHNPYAQTRLSMLDGTLAQLSSGELRPILTNALQAFLAFFWPGYGDQFLAYNIPGRPVLDAFTAIFFLIGLIVSLRRWRQPANAFLLIWYVTGIIPSLVTGPTANTTRNLAALPAVYLLGAVGFLAAARWLAARLSWSRRTVLTIGALAWFGIVLFVSARDYFGRWGESPEVRGAYQHTLIEELDYLQGHISEGQQVLLSSVYPGPAHDPSIALVVAGDGARQWRWSDARYALVLPSGPDSVAAIPASTPPHQAFADVLEPQETVILRPDDRDPSYTYYTLEGASLAANPTKEPLADFGAAIELLDAQWLAGPVSPGNNAELLTVWRVTNPANIGPAHAPTFTTDAVFFTHLLDASGAIVSQRDALDAPSWSWHDGDIILQIHQLPLGADLPAGAYEAFVGIYDRPTGERLPLFDDQGATNETMFPVPLLEVAQTSG